MIYIALGANIGDRAAQLSAAIDEMERAGLHVTKQSSVYETAPVGYTEQPSFFNMVVEVESRQSSDELLNTLQQIEQRLGRERLFKNGPRTIDLDILYAGDQCSDSGGLIVPHPRWTTRRFVLQPLADVRGALVLPGQTDSVSTLLANLQSDEKLNRLDDEW